MYIFDIYNHWCQEKITKNLIYFWIDKGLEHRCNAAGLESHQPNPVKKIKKFFVKKSELFERSEISDFRKIF
jgi:hypothetical protein